MRPSRRLVLRALRLMPVFFALVSCDTSTAPETPFVPDTATLERAMVVHVDLAANSVISANSASDVAFSLVGRDVIDATVTNLTRASFNKRKDIVRFDVAITNRIPGVELRPPTLAPVPPNGTASVFVFPYMVSVTGGAGVVNESTDWDGAPFSFFNDLICRNNRTSDCFPWEAYDAPVLPGATSAARNVGFLVDKSVTSFDVYLLTAADIVSIPTGALQVNVSSATRGPLAAVKVVVDGSITAVSDLAGAAQFASIATGAHSVTLSDLPALCSAPGALAATVNANQTTIIAADVACVEPPAPAALAVDATTHNFGSVLLGATSAARSFTIANGGGSQSAPLTVVLSGADASQFAITANSCDAGGLAPAVSCVIQVAFTPTVAGARSAALSIGAMPGGTLSVILVGGGDAGTASLSLTPSPRDFGSVGVGFTSASQTFTVVNMGNVPAPSVSVFVVGSNPGDFAVVEDPSSTCASLMQLSAGQSCTLAIAFTPAVTGARSALLVVSSTGAPSATAPMAGVGLIPAQLTLSPPSETFGSVVVGGLDEPQRVFTVTNVGQASGAVSVRIAGANAAHFGIVASDCVASLAPAATCSVTVSFHPTDGGIKSALLQASAEPGGAVSASLSGTGLKPPVFAISPPSYEFFLVIVGSERIQPFIVTNVGDLPGLADWSYIDNPHFRIQFNECAGRIIVPGGWCVISVSFAPSAAGSHQGSLHVENAFNPQGSVEAFLTGYAQAPKLALIDPQGGTIDFGDRSIAAGASSVVSIRIKNIGTAVTTPLTVTQSGTGGFVIVLNQCATAVLLADATCTIQIIFDPSDIGPNAGQVSINLGTDPPILVELRGSGTP